MKKWTAVIAACATLSLTAAGTATAQYYDNSGGLWATSTTTTTTAVTVGGIVLTVVLVAGAARADMETYIRNNAVALQQDITMGGGETTRDLAAAYNVSPTNLDAFGQLLREHRGELLPLTDVDALNEERAGEFAQVIYDAMVSHPELASDLVVRVSAG